MRVRGFATLKRAEMYSNTRYHTPRAIGNTTFLSVTQADHLNHADIPTHTLVKAVRVNVNTPAAADLGLPPCSAASFVLPRRDPRPTYSTAEVPL